MYLSTHVHGFGHLWFYILTCLNVCLEKNNYMSKMEACNNLLRWQSDLSTLFFTNKRPVSLIKYIILIRLVLVFYPNWMIPKVILEAFMTRTSRKKRHKKRRRRIWEKTAQGQLLYFIISWFRNLSMRLDIYYSTHWKFN